MNRSLLNSTRDLHLISFHSHAAATPGDGKYFAIWRMETGDFLIPKQLYQTKIFFLAARISKLRTFFTHSLNRTNHTANHVLTSTNGRIYKRSLPSSILNHRQQSNRVGLFELNKYMPTAYLSVFVVLPQSPCCFCPPLASRAVSRRGSNWNGSGCGLQIYAYRIEKAEEYILGIITENTQRL